MQILLEILDFPAFFDFFQALGCFTTSGLVKSPGHANSQPRSPPWSPSYDHFFNRIFVENFEKVTFSLNPHNDLFLRPPGPGTPSFG